MISRTAKWVAGVHGAVLLVLLLSSLLKDCSFRRKKPEPLTIDIAMVSAPAAAATPQIQEVQQMPLENVQPPAPKPAPKPTPIPEPEKKVTKPKPKTEPKKTEPPKKKWEPKKVERQDTRVRNPNLKPKQTTQPTPDISKALQGALPKTVTASSSSSLPASYGQVIQSRMYAAWRQPSIATHQSRGAVVRIRIEKNGIISSVSLERSSGNSQIDQTALQAARSVRLPELPANITQSSISVTVEFMLTD